MVTPQMDCMFVSTFEDGTEKNALVMQFDEETAGAEHIAAPL